MRGRIEPDAAAVGVAGGDDRAVGRDDPAAPRAGRLGGRRPDDTEKLLRIVRRRERLAEAGERLAHAPALSLELAKPGLELRGHVVERRAELRELVAATHRHAIAEAPARDAAGSHGEAAEVPHDRAALQVGDHADERQTGEKPEQDAVTTPGIGCVDERLRGQDGEPRPRYPWQRRCDESAVAGSCEVDRRAAPRLDRDPPAQRRRGRGNARSLEQNEDVAGVERGTAPQTLHEPRVERDRGHDLAQAARRGDDIDERAVRRAAVGFRRVGRRCRRRRATAGERGFASAPGGRDCASARCSVLDRATRSARACARSARSW